MKILVTGSAGFIGYHLCLSLIKQGYEVLGLDNINNYYDQNLKNSRLNRLKKYQNFIFKKVDITDKESLSDAFESFIPNKVVNLAAQGGVRHSIGNPLSYVSSNIIGFINIIELCRNLEVDGLIYASSSSVYGRNDKIPFSIDDTKLKPLALYGVTKVTNELISYAYSNLYDLNTTGLRYFTVYGPWYRPDMAMFVFVKKIISGQPIEVFGNGKMQRDFTYIDDIVSGTISAIDKNYKNEIFNLGNNVSERLSDMIVLIEEELGKKAIINFSPMHKAEMGKTCADITYSQKKLDYEPKTTIKKGIPKFISWYREYYNV